MSRSRAPMDMRMPISRVRSATLTSMMFITPTPPTSRLIAATAMPEQRQRAEDGVGRLAHLGLRAHLEVVAALLEVVPLAQDARDLLLGAVDGLRRSSR